MQQVCVCSLLTDYLPLTPESGTLLAQFLNEFDDHDTVSLDGFHPKLSEEKIEEKLEALLSPDTNSLFVKIRLGRRPHESKKQKLNVVMLLDK